MQHILATLQQEKSSSYSILVFVISLFGYPGPSSRPLLCTPLVVILSGPLAVVAEKYRLLRVNEAKDLVVVRG